MGSKIGDEHHSPADNLDDNFKGAFVRDLIKGAIIMLLQLYIDFNTGYCSVRPGLPAHFHDWVPWSVDGVTVPG